MRLLEGGIDVLDRLSHSRTAIKAGYVHVHIHTHCLMSSESHHTHLMASESYQGSKKLLVQDLGKKEGPEDKSGI